MGYGREGLRIVLIWGGWRATHGVGKPGRGMGLRRVCSALRQPREADESQLTLNKTHWMNE